MCENTIKYTRQKIAFLIDTIYSDTGGTEKQLFNIIRRFNKDKFEVFLICLHETPWIRKNNNNVKIISLGYKGIIKFNFLKVVRGLAEVLQQEKIDILQTFFEESIYVAYLARLFSPYKPILLSSRRDLGLGIDEPLYHQLFQKIRPYITRNIDGVVTNAAAIKKYIVKNESVDPSRITIIPNGLDLPEKYESIPTIIQSHPESIWIGIVANLKPIKRIDIFIKALSILKQRLKGKEIRGIILGEGDLLNSFQTLAKTLKVYDCVHFMGVCSNVDDYLQNIDIGVLCSDKEGLSNAILEYMANGLPVVATNVGGNPELVDERNGFCIPPGNAIALADRLEHLINSPALRQYLGNQSIRKVHERHLWDEIMPKWESFYQMLSIHKNEKRDENHP